MDVQSECPIYTHHSGISFKNILVMLQPLVQGLWSTPPPPPILGPEPSNQTVRTVKKNASLRWGRERCGLMTVESQLKLTMNT